MNKKRIVSFLIVVVIGLLSVNLVSAQYLDIRQGSEDLINFVVDWGEPFLQATLGGGDYTGHLLFERFLLFILLLGLVFVGLSKVPVFEDNKAILWTLSIIVPLLSVRFMDWNWLNTILMQYQVLGIAIAGILPFIVYLFFLHNVFENNSTGRKIGWIFFIVIYLGLWSTSAAEAYAEVYFWTMLIAFVFLLFDGTIHKALLKQQWNQAKDSGYIDAITRIDKRIEYLEASKIPDSRKKREIKRLERRRYQLFKQVS